MGPSPSSPLSQPQSTPSQATPGPSAANNTTPRWASPGLRTDRRGDPQPPTRGRHRVPLGQTQAEAAVGTAVSTGWGASRTEGQREEGQGVSLGCRGTGVPPPDMYVLWAERGAGQAGALTHGLRPQCTYRCRGRRAQPACESTRPPHAGYECGENHCALAKNEAPPERQSTNQSANPDAAPRAEAPGFPRRGPHPARSSPAHVTCWALERVPQPKAALSVPQARVPGARRWALGPDQPSQTSAHLSPVHSMTPQGCSGRAPAHTSLTLSGGRTTGRASERTQRKESS